MAAAAATTTSEAVLPQNLGHVHVSADEYRTPRAAVHIVSYSIRRASGKLLYSSTTLPTFGKRSGWTCRPETTIFTAARELLSAERSHSH